MASTFKIRAYLLIACLDAASPFALDSFQSLDKRFIDEATTSATFQPPDFDEELAESCGVGYLPLAKTDKCQLNGYTCVTGVDGSACCDGRQPETRACVPCDETHLKAADGTRYTTAGSCSTAATVKYTDAYGGNGGGAVDSFCKSGKYIDYWKLRTGSLVDKIQGRCNDGTWLQACGGDGGNEWEGVPAWGTQKMQVRTGSLVDKFNDQGGDGGEAHWMDCGTGYRITGYKLRCGSLVDNVQMQCTAQVQDTATESESTEPEVSTSTPTLEPTSAPTYHCNPFPQCIMPNFDAIQKQVQEQQPVKWFADRLSFGHHRHNLGTVVYNSQERLHGLRDSAQYMVNRAGTSTGDPLAKFGAEAMIPDHITERSKRHVVVLPGGVGSDRPVHDITPPPLLPVGDILTPPPGVTAPAANKSATDDFDLSLDS